MCGVLLVSVGEGDVHPCLHIMRGTAACCGSWLDSGTAEGGVLELEGFALSLLRGSRESILTRAAQEEEGDGTQVKDCVCSGGLRVVVELLGQRPENCDVNGPNS